MRPFEHEDAPAVAELFQTVAYDPWPSAAAVADYLRELFLDGPWYDPQIPSWVAVENGRVIGFEGMMARPMVHGNKPIRVAVSCQLFVHPDFRRGLAAIQMLRAMLGGPQDATLADGATETAAKVWNAMGGIVSPLHRFSWFRPVRPARALLWMAAQRRSWLRPAAALGRPFASAMDACVARIPPFRVRPSLREENLDVPTLLGAVNEIAARYTLRPQYDLDSLGWVIGQITAKKRHGPLCARLLRDPDGKVAGWFLYYLDRGGMSRVVQLAARPDRTRATLEHLFRHAADHGALALEGRVEPRFIGDMSNMQCLFQASGELTLIHARDPALMASLMQGDAFFTRVEGEWWLRFHGEPHGAGDGRAPGARQPGVREDGDLAAARS